MHSQLSNMILSFIYIRNFLGPRDGLENLSIDLKNIRLITFDPSIEVDNAFSPHKSKK